jgi:hypothetical protein
VSEESIHTRPGGEEPFHALLHAHGDSCPENRQIAGILRRLGGVPFSRSGFDWQDGDPRGQAGLASETALIDAGKALAEFYENARLEQAGHEHELFLPPHQPDRIFKVTLNGAYGCRLRFSPFDPDLEERYFRPEVSLDPRSYLLRWLLLNTVTPYRTRLEAIFPPIPPLREWRLCVSQDLLPPTRLSDSAIQQHMVGYGFERIGRDAYFHAGRALILGDLSPRNAALLDGSLIPFDAIAEVISPEVIRSLAELP